MEFTELISSAAGLGGAGAFLRYGLQKASESHKERMQESRLKWEAEQDSISATREFMKAVVPATGAWVHRLMALAAFIILMAPILLPIFFDVTVHYYWPRTLDFIFFEIEKMKEVTAGNGSKHIMILPIHITASLNILSFYLTGKGFKT